MDDQPNVTSQPGDGSPMPTGPKPSMSPQEEHTWAIVCHLSAFAAFTSIPFANVLGPLVVWLIKRHESALVDFCGKQALNFQITMAIAGIACIPLCFIIIGIPLLFAVAITDIVFTIMAAVKTSNGERYEYPIAIRFFK